MEQLDESDPERFMHEVRALNAQRRAPSLPKEETELLLKINRGLPAEIHARTKVLNQKRQDEVMNDLDIKLNPSPK
ncbi:MAG: hypothetical protein ACE5GO_03840 [Anaerolineales bacterium]